MIAINITQIQHNMVIGYTVCPFLLYTPHTIQELDNEVKCKMILEARLPQRNE